LPTNAQTYKLKEKSIISLVAMIGGTCANVFDIKWTWSHYQLYDI